MKKKETSSYYAPAIITYAIGFVVLYFAVQSGIKNHEMKSWLKTEAVVTEAIPLHVNTDDYNYYVPEVTYTYSVNGQQYTSFRLSYDKKQEKCESLSECKQLIIDRYQPASTIKAFYNPKEPSEAVLLYGDQFGHLFVQILICIFTFTIAIRAHYLSGSLFKAVGTDV